MLGGTNRHTIDDEDEDDCEAATRHHIKIADPPSIPHKCMRIYQPPPGYEELLHLSPKQKVT
jgi:hypothetical protein